MRTTIDLEIDVLMAVKELARQTDSSMGKVLSDLVRRALRGRTEFAVKNGFPQFPIREDGEVVTLELVNRLRDETP